jgi:hypothetical protein
LVAVMILAPLFTGIAMWIWPVLQHWAVGLCAVLCSFATFPVYLLFYRRAAVCLGLLCPHCESPLAHKDIARTGVCTKCWKSVIDHETSG